MGYDPAKYVARVRKDKRTDMECADCSNLVSLRRDGIPHRLCDDCLDKDKLRARDARRFAPIALVVVALAHQGCAATQEECDPQKHESCDGACVRDPSGVALCYAACTPVGTCDVGDVNHWSCSIESSGVVACDERPWVCYCVVN